MTARDRRRNTQATIVLKLFTRLLLSGIQVLGSIHSPSLFTRPRHPRYCSAEPFSDDVIPVHGSWRRMAPRRPFYHLRGPRRNGPDAPTSGPKRRRNCGWRITTIDKPAVVLHRIRQKLSPARRTLLDCSARAQTVGHC